MDPGKHCGSWYHTSWTRWRSQRGRHPDPTVTPPRPWVPVGPISGRRVQAVAPVHAPFFSSQVTDVLWFEVSRHLLLPSFKKKLLIERSLLVYHLQIESVYACQVRRDDRDAEVLFRTR